MIEFLQKELGGKIITPITRECFDRAAQIYAANPDFCTDDPLKNVKRDFDALPTGCAKTQKIYAIISEKTCDVAVLDLICGFPNVHTLWIGLLMLDKARQGRGLGNMFVAAILIAAKNAGYDTVQLGVLKTNNKAMFFWNRQGFEFIKETNTTVVLQKYIT